MKRTVAVGATADVAIAVKVAIVIAIVVVAVVVAIVIRKFVVVAVVREWPPGLELESSASRARARARVPRRAEPGAATRSVGGGRARRVRVHAEKKSQQASASCQRRGVRACAHGGWCTKG